MRTQTSARRAARREWAMALIAGCACLVAVACKDITTLQQSNPGAVDASKVYVPANAQLLTNGAIADFECAYQRYVVGSGLFADELSDAISSTANYDYDARRLQTNATYGTNICGANQQPPIYATLSTARASADTILAKLQGWTDAQMPTGVNRTKLLGQAAAYAGYSFILLGEGMCTAAINLGPEETPAQLFADAKSRFDIAVTAATTANDTTTLNFALLGRARAELDLNDPADIAAAGTDAAKIPAGFIVSTGGDAVNIRRENFAYYQMVQNAFSTVDTTFRGLTVNGAPDPRVAVTNINKNGTTPGSHMWTPDKYPSLATPMPIARYAEAQLIVADAKIAVGDIPGAVAAINAARATHSIAPFDATGLTVAQVKAQLIEERRRELFLEGHRLGDLRRYNLPFTPAAGTTYPGGGGQYGTQTCFPLPDVERINNPNVPDTP